jgi:hypothetical protein
MKEELTAVNKDEWYYKIGTIRFAICQVRKQQELCLYPEAILSSNLILIL